MIVFPPFALDPANEQLLRDGKPLSLRPKTFAVLRYLAERPGQLVTKDALLTTVWPGTFVTDNVLKGCVTELRKVLADGAASPRVIQTVHRRGYRFIATVGSGADHPESPPQKRVARFVDRVVGRDAERDQLLEALARARAGERQVMLVSGEAGMGKTALVQSFLAEAASAPEPSSIAVGQCVAQYGSGEPFLPLLEALDRLCRASEGTRVVDLLRRLAPEWLLQLPGIIPSDEHTELKRQADPAARDRMLRVGVAFLEALAADRPVVLVIEDMHWSDHSTVDLLSRLAERTDPTRLLVLATYRPAEAIVREHPLRAVSQELQVRRRCSEMALGFLDEHATEEYLRARFPGAPLPAGLVAWLRRRTDGNPLFMVSLVDELVAQSPMVEHDGRAIPGAGFEHIGVPESLRQMIEQQIDRLPPEDQGLLDAAAVAGAEFSAATVAAALGADVVDVEARLRAWAQRGQFVRDSGHAVWPDGTVAAHLAFVHSLYREVQYQRVPPARRAQLHRRIGERLEAACASEPPKGPAELALHFEQCGDLPKAIEYLRQTARQARRRGAHHEVVAALAHAVELARQQPDTPERTRELVALHLRTGPSLVVTKGLTHAAVKEAYEAAGTLADTIGDPVSSLLARLGVWGVGFLRADPVTATTLTDGFLHAAETTSVPAFSIAAHAIVGTDAFYRGDLERAATHLERALAADVEPPAGLRPEPRSMCLGASSFVLCLSGRVDEARACDAEVRARAQTQRDAFDRAWILVVSMQLGLYLRDPSRVASAAEPAELLMCEHEIPLVGLPRFGRTWCHAVSGDVTAVAEMKRILDELENVGMRRSRPLCLALLAEQELACGRVADALAHVDAAFVTMDATGERVYESEVHRLHGECRRAGDAIADAERSFMRALDVARGQKARWLELRVATSLAALLLDLNRVDEGRAFLGPLYESFSQGHDTRDLLAAKTLLDR